MINKCSRNQNWSWFFLRKENFFLIPCSFHKLLFLHFLNSFFVCIYCNYLKRHFSYAAMKCQSQQCLTSKLKSFLKNGWQLSKTFATQVFFSHKFYFFKHCAAYIFQSIFVLNSPMCANCVSVLKSPLLKDNCILWLKFVVVTVPDKYFWWWQQRQQLLSNNWSDIVCYLWSREIRLSILLSYAEWNLIWT